jgi:hypothetical protein
MKIIRDGSISRDCYYNTDNELIELVATDGLVTTEDEGGVLLVNELGERQGDRVLVRTASGFVGWTDADCLEDVD